MRKTWVWLALALIVSSYAWAAPKFKRSIPKSPKARRISDRPLRLSNTCVAVCSIVDPTATRPMGFARGSGFFVTPVHVITCHHLLSVPSPFGPVPADRVIIEWADGRQCPARLVATEKYHDLALLEIADCRWRGSPAPLNDSACEHGQAIRVAGLFDPSGFWVAEGRIEGCNVLDGFALGNAKVRSGFSGGPVFAQDATVVGMLSQRDDARNAIFVRSDVIRRFLQAAGVATPEE
ncbi:MAG: serine protease [Candidatus Sumerlaeaceae bacterium]|nr:serine protease [Candidatus Sumerlaeaceae bacterium]